MLHADIAIIGAGPGGYVAALRASQLGARVVCIEKRWIGGVCLNEGCIPTKALLRSAEVLTLVKEASTYGVVAGEPRFDWAKAQERKERVVEQLVGGVTMLLDRAGIEVIEGDYPGPIIDSPTYDFDEKNGRLRGYLSFDINDSLVLVYGSGSSVSGAGGGRENMLHGVYQLPHRSGNLTVLKIDVDGTVYLEYGDNLVILREGEKWENITSEMDVAFSGTAEFTITDWVKNYGFLQKSKIEAR